MEKEIENTVGQGNMAAFRKERMQHKGKGITF